MTTQRLDLAEREFIPGFEGFRRRRRAARDTSERPNLQDPSLVDTGFYAADAGLSFTGTPQTEGERDFIIDFINQHGARPNQFDVSEFLRNQPNPYALDESRVYAPGSLMAELGFRTGADYRRAQQAEQTYGPFAGERVPFGGLVTYDPLTGQPLTRSFETNAAIRRGEFIPPPGGLGVTQRSVFGELPESQFLRDFGVGGDIGAFEGLEQFYPRSGQVTFQAPTLQQAEEQGLIKTDPIDLYGANLYDYLASQMFPQRGAGGEIFREGMTTEEANEILAEAERLIKRGVSPEQLPFFNESQGAGGEETATLRDRVYQETVTGLREEWEQRRFGGQRGRAGAVPSPGEGGRGVFGGGGAPQPTGTERGEYLQWIKDLGLPYNPSQWAIGQFRNMYDIWLAQGSGSFIDWVENYMAPLEEFEQVPQFGERIQAPRARVLRR